MNRACGSILLTYALYVYLGDQIFATAGAINMSKGLQGLWNQTLTLFNKTESALANNLAPSVGHRIVTDVNFGGHRMAEIFEDKNTSDFINCNVIGDKNLTEYILKVIPEALVTDVTIEEMNQFIDKCLDREPATEGSSFLEILGDAFRSLVIFPGTKWCGAGDIAKNYDDLGKESDTDRCCRDHDHSEDNIPALGTEHGIKNPMLYTMTACPYDRKFYNCLQNVSSFTSVTIGVLFFDVLNTKCFDYGYPTKCTDYNYWRLLLLQGPCEETAPDTSKPKEWHVVSPPNFLETFIERKENETSNSSISEENEVGV
ncbi:uncharacterized protein LOC144094631 [Amblyomma americanum]